MHVNNANTIAAQVTITKFTCTYSPVNGKPQPLIAGRKRPEVESNPKSNPRILHNARQRRVTKNVTKLGFKTYLQHDLVMYSPGIPCV